MGSQHKRLQALSAATYYLYQQPNSLTSSFAASVGRLPLDVTFPAAARQSNFPQECQIWSKQLPTVRCQQHDSACNCHCKTSASLHADPIEVDSVPEQADPHYKPMWARWLAVAVCVLVGVTAASEPEVWRQATATFVQQQQQWEKLFQNLPRCGKIEAPGRFVRRWFTKLLKGASDCEDDPRAGRPRLLSLEVAARAAALVKQGRWVKVKVGKHTHHRLVYFTSIQDAVDHTTELQDILRNNGVTVHQLREAMHAADPTLVRRRITFKRALSKEEKRQRVQSAKLLIDRVESNPDILHNMVFIDETTIVLQGGGHEHVAVWCDKNDVSFNDVCPLPIGHKADPTKVHVIAAVSAHPAFKASNGLVYVDFTTGTSHIRRRHNKRMDGSMPDPAYNYQVGTAAGVLHWVKHTDLMRGSCHVQSAGGRKHGVLQHTHIQPLLALPTCVALGIGWCEHNGSTMPSCIQSS